MELEWDEAKRQWTLDNRGLDFADIVHVDMATLRITPDDRRDYGEPRFNAMAMLDDRLIAFSWTPHNGRIRIISMRKANERERKIHQGPGAWKR